MLVGESRFRLEYPVPQLVPITVLKLLLGRRRHVGLLVNRIILAALDRVEQDLRSLLNALEEVVILIALTGGRFLVRMVTEDLLAVCALDLFRRGFVSVFAKTEDSVVVLFLRRVSQPLLPI